MFRIKTMNSISPAGIEALTAHGCDVSADEVRPERRTRHFSEK